MMRSLLALAVAVGTVGTASSQQPASPVIPTVALKPGIYDGFSVARARPLDAPEDDDDALTPEVVKKLLVRRRRLMEEKRRLPDRIAELEATAERQKEMLRRGAEGGAGMLLIGVDRQRQFLRIRSSELRILRNRGRIEEIPAELRKLEKRILHGGSEQDAPADTERRPANGVIFVPPDAKYF